ncbi:arsenite efflux transporter metallochaperone ArsD [Trichococcus paludicola]|uniref:arsenite efflux transporter metallochaperone ArsD n=1 Tax=Trichococcus paludicola TaxID=2052942 RepID=UPI0018FFB060|nr:arsenite efflux transporter metallochaperone ArsD [Trichococcus paludicola]
MTNITIFEPAMCCNTGVCGPSIDQDLLRITAVMDALGGLENYEALRYNLSSNPDQFVLNKAVSEKLQAEGMDALPLTVVDGQIVKTGGYPTNDEITEYIGVRFIEETEDSCCGGGCGCGGSEEFDEAEKVETEEKEESGCCGGKGNKGGCGCGGQGRHHHHHDQHEEVSQEKGSCCGGQSGCC